MSELKINIVLNLEKFFGATEKVLIILYDKK